jgi:hypothetical protein
VPLFGLGVYLCCVEFAAGEDLLLGGGITQIPIDGIETRQFKELSDRSAYDGISAAERCYQSLNQRAPPRTFMLAVGPNYGQVRTVMARGDSAQTRRNRRRGRAGHAGGGMSGESRGLLRGVLMWTEGRGMWWLPREGRGVLVPQGCVRVWRLVFGPFPRQLKSACITLRISWPITGPVLHVHGNVFA